MDRRVLRDLLILIAIVIIAAVGARILASGETLTDYAKKNPEAALVSGTSDTSALEASIDTTSQHKETSIESAPQQEGSMKSSPQQETLMNTTPLQQETSMNTPPQQQEASMNTTSQQQETSVDTLPLQKEASVSPAQNSSDIGSEEYISSDTPAIATEEISTEAVSPTKDTSASENPDRITYADGFYYEPISDDVFSRISGISYPADCSIPLDDLRYVVLQYIDFEGNPQSGELICNKDLAQDFVEIFYELYNNDYQLESVKLVDEFGGDPDHPLHGRGCGC